jgi:hypothetical protein
MADTQKKTAATPAPGRKVKVTRKERRARTEAARPKPGPHASLRQLRVTPRKVRLVADRSSLARPASPGSRSSGPPTR